MLTFPPRTKKDRDLITGAGLVGNSPLAVAVGMGSRGAVRDFRDLGRACGTRQAAWAWRRFRDGFKGQVGVFETKVDRAIQAEFEADFILGTDAQGLMRQHLEESVLESQGEIVGELAVGLNTEDFIELICEGAKRPMGIDGRDRGDRIMRVMGREVEVPQEAVGGDLGGYAGQAQFFDEPILVGIEAALDASFGLWGVGADHLDIEFFHGASELGNGLEILQFFVDGGLAVDLVDRVFVDIVGDRPAMTAQVGAGRAQKGQRVFNVHKLGVKNPAGGVINIDDEHAARPASFEPVMVRPVELDQHAYAVAALAPRPVANPGAMCFPEPCLDHALA